MNRDTLFKVSLVLNGILAAALVFVSRQPGKPGPVSSSHPAAEAAGSRASLNESPHPVSSAEVKPAARSGPAWEGWVAALRAAGAPDNVLARVVLAEFDARWDKRFDDSQSKFERGEIDFDGLSALSREHDREQEREIRAALGEAGFRAWDQDNIFKGMNLRRISVSASETNALYDMQKGLRQTFRELEAAKEAGEIDEADFNDRQSKAQSDYDQRLKTLLGEKRYTALQGVDDSGAGDLRRNLRKVNASDEQFAALLDAQRDWIQRRNQLDQQLQSNQTQNLAYEDQIRTLDQMRDQEYQRVLGTNAFDAFQKGQDGRYTKLQHFANTWGLDDGNIDFLYTAMKYYEKSVEDYRQQARVLEQKGESVDWDAVNQNLRQFSKQTEESILNYLGQDRFDRMKRNDVFPFESEP